MTLETQEIHRMLTPTEHRFLNAPNAKVAFVIRFTGEINQNLLENAIEKVKVRHPIIGVKVSYDENHRSWIKFDPNLKIPIRSSQKTETNQWHNEIQKELINYQDPTEKSLIRFILLIGKPESEIIIYCNHAICDGMSMVYLTEDIMTSLADPSHNFQTIPNTPMDSHNLIGFKEPKGLIKAVLSKIHEKWDSDPYYFQPDDFQAIDKGLWKHFKYSLIHEQLSKNQTQSLVEKCKREGVTVNSAICTAFRAALEQYHGTKTKYMDNISIAVNMRDQLSTEQKKFFGYAASAIRPKFKYNFNKSFWDNVRKFHSKPVKLLQKGAAIKDLVGGASLSHPMIDAMSVAGLAQFVSNDYPGYKKMKDFSKKEDHVILKLLKRKNLLDTDTIITAFVCTNLGRLSISTRYGAYEITGTTLVPSAHTLWEITISANTINNHLDLTVGSIRQKEEIEKLQEILKIALKLLLE